MKKQRILSLFMVSLLGVFSTVKESSAYGGDSYFDDLLSPAGGALFAGVGYASDRFELTRTASVGGTALGPLAGFELSDRDTYIPVYVGYDFKLGSNFFLGVQLSYLFGDVTLNETATGVVNLRADGPVSEDSPGTFTEWEDTNNSYIVSQTSTGTIDQAYDYLITFNNSYKLEDQFEVAGRFGVLFGEKQNFSVYVKFGVAFSDVKFTQTLGVSNGPDDLLGKRDVPNYATPTGFFSEDFVFEETKSNNAFLYGVGVQVQLGELFSFWKDSYNEPYNRAKYYEDDLAGFFVRGEFQVTEWDDETFRAGGLLLFEGDSLAVKVEDVRSTQWSVTVGYRF